MISAQEIYEKVKNDEKKRAAAAGGLGALAAGSAALTPELTAVNQAGHVGTGLMGSSIYQLALKEVEDRYEREVEGLPLYGGMILSGAASGAFFQGVQDTTELVPGDYDWESVAEATAGSTAYSVISKYLDGKEETEEKEM